MTTLFAPGCALNRYKPERIAEISRLLLESGRADAVYLTCCKSEIRPPEKARLIVCCPGCSHVFGSRCPGSEVISLWRVLLDVNFPFPDYHGQRMSIHDACQARGRDSEEMQESARALCQRMNIRLIEPEWTGDEARCCGGSAKDLESRRRMALSRAAEFTEENVVVYCTGCARSFSITPVRPRHLLDLLFGEPTEGLYPPGIDTEPGPKGD